MQLSVIIVNYNVRYFLEQALTSVQKAAKGLDVEVFVVDNASKDDSVQMVKEKFPEVILIENKDNPGFSIANNQAIAQAKGKYVLLLNPDTVVAEDTFLTCIDFLEKHPDAGGLGVKMVDGSGAFLPESKRGFPSPWVAFCKSTGLSSIFKKSKLFNGYHLGYLSPDENHPIDVLSGAFVMMPKEALEKAGYLDETFFMYGEDIDLSYRLKKAGYQNYYLADTTILHYKGESTKKGSLNYVKAFYQAMIIFAGKHFTGQKARLFILMLQAAIYLKAALTLLNNLFKTIKLPVLDIGMMWLGMYLLPKFWANYYFQNPGYFDHPKFYLVNVPLYIGLWVIGIFLSGGYDRPISIRRLVQGIFAGTIVVAAVYGFLPLSYRFSRALVILGAIWALLGTSGIRILLHFLQYNNFNIGEYETKNLAIVGTFPEGERALKVMQQVGVQKNLIGYVAPDQYFEKDKHIGSIGDLENLKDIFDLNEVIFCSRDVTNKIILEQMEKLQGKLIFKILPEGVNGIIGSASKNRPGELYTMEVDYGIAKPMNRRNKRTFDFIISIPLLIVSPLYLFFRKAKWLHPGNIARVLIGQNTWIGYIGPEEANNKYPKVRTGIFTVADGFSDTGYHPYLKERINFQYAKDYSVSWDFRVLRRVVMR